MRGSRYLLLCAAILFIALLSCAISLKLGMWGFLGFDASPMIDAGWRVLQGQAPGRDFVVVFPPSLYLLVALAFHLFGVTWHSLIVVQCLSYLLLLLLGLRVGSFLQHAWGFRAAASVVAVYAMAQTAMELSANFPWHAPMAESYAAYATLATLALLGEMLSKRRQVVEMWAHLGLASAVLVLSKPNTAWPTLLVCFGVLWVAKVSRVALVSTFLAALVLAELALAHVGTGLLSMAHGYLGLTGRLMPRGMFYGVLNQVDPHFGFSSLVVFAVLAPAATAVAVLLWRSESESRMSPVLLLAVGAALAGLLGMATNFDFKLSDTPMLLMSFSIFAWCVPGVAMPALRFRTVCAALALLALAGYFARVRYRVLWSAWGCEAVSIQDTFLGNMRTCAYTTEPLAEADEALAQQRGKRIFFGPMMEYLYAARGIPSPLHLPNWWHPGTSFPQKREGEISQAWVNDRFEVLIFDKTEMRNFIPKAITDRIDSDYVLQPGTSAIHVYVRADPMAKR